MSRLFPLLLVGVTALSVGIGLLNNGACSESVYFKDGLNTLSAHYMASDVDKPPKGFFEMARNMGTAKARLGYSDSVKQDGLFLPWPRITMMLVLP